MAAAHIGFSIGHALTSGMGQVEGAVRPEIYAVSCELWLQGSSI